MAEIISFDRLSDFSDADLPPSDWHCITQEKVDEFSRLAGDDQWIHIDTSRAQEKSPFGSTIVHGYLILAFTPLMLDEIYSIEGSSMGINRGFNRLRFIHPLITGDSLRLKARLTGTTFLEGSVDTVWSLEYEGMGYEKLVCAAELIKRYCPVHRD